MKNNQGFSNILLIVVFLVLFGVVGFFGYNYYLTSNSLPNYMPKLPGSDQLTNDDSNKDDPSKIVESVKKEIEDKNLSRIESITSENGDVWWITEDGYNVLTENDPTINIIVENKRRQENYPDPRNEGFDEINLIVKNKLLSQGFKLNQLNSNGLEISGYKDRIDFTQAYEKPGIKCVETATFDILYATENGQKIFSQFYLGCTTDEKINQNYMTLKPFIDILANARGEDRKTFVISYLSIEGETARASFSGSRTGGVVSYYKENVTWKYLHTGQEEEDCADLIKRGDPKKFQRGCKDYK